MRKSDDVFVGGNDRGNMFPSLHNTTPMHPALSTLIEEQVGRKIMMVALIGVLFALFSLIVDGGFGLALAGIGCAVIVGVTADNMLTSSVTVGHGEIMGQLYQRVLACKSGILSKHESRLVRIAQQSPVNHNWGFPIHDVARSAVSQEVKLILEHWPPLKTLHEEFETLENPLLVEKQYGGRMWDVWPLWLDALNAEVTVSVLRHIMNQTGQNVGEQA